jgi:hypothetical protein
VIVRSFRSLIREVVVILLLLLAALALVVFGVVRGRAFTALQQEKGKR